MVNEKNIKEVAKIIKSSVDWLKKTDGGCSHYDYGGVCIVIGWMPGYDDKVDDGDIHSISEPTCCITAGVRTQPGVMSCDMETDFNYLYWPDTGDCWIADVAVSANEDYETLAKYLIETADEMIEYEFEEDGKILGHRDYVELKNDIDSELGDWSDKEDFEIMLTKIEDAKVDDDERIELKNRLQEAYDDWSKTKPVDYDKRAVEKEYDCAVGELDCMTLKEAEEYLDCEPGELDRFIKQSNFEVNE